MSLLPEIATLFSFLNFTGLAPQVGLPLLAICINLPWLPLASQKHLSAEWSIPYSLRVINPSGDTPKSTAWCDLWGSKFRTLNPVLKGSNRNFDGTKKRPPGVSAPSWAPRVPDPIGTASERVLPRKIASSNKLRVDQARSRVVFIWKLGMILMSEGIARIIYLSKDVFAPTMRTIWWSWH